MTDSLLNAAYHKCSIPQVKVLSSESCRLFFELFPLILDLLYELKKECSYIIIGKSEKGEFNCTVYEKPEVIKVDSVNAEIRRIMIEKYGRDRYIKDADFVS